MPEARTIQLSVGSGEMDCYLAEPNVSASVGLVLAMSIWGVNAELRRIAEEYALLGYTVVAPNLFWRTHPGHGVDFEAEEFPTCVEAMQAAEDRDSVRDLDTARRHLVAMGCAAVATIGWCLGGRISCLAAKGGTLDSVVAYYPTYLEAHLEIASSLPCPVQLHLPEFDEHVTRPDAREVIEDAFRDVKNADVFVYPGTGHGFDFGANFDHHAARLADIRTALFLDRRRRPRA